MSLVTNVDDYPYIRAWNQLLGGDIGYLNDQLAKARRLGAPQNSTYYNLTEDRFHTLDEVTSQVTLADLERILDEARRRLSRGQSLGA